MRILRMISLQMVLVVLIRNPPVELLLKICLQEGHIQRNRVVHSPKNTVMMVCSSITEEILK